MTSPSSTPRWYRLTTSYLPVTYVHVSPSRAASSEFAYAEVKAVKVPPRDWLEREIGKARDTVLREQARISTLTRVLALTDRG